MGLNPSAVSRCNVAIACWPWGSYLGDDGIANGIRLKVSSWQRHDPNADPDRRQGDRDVHQLLARQGRGAARPATTRRCCSRPTATSRRARARTSSSSATASCILTPPNSDVGRARGHHPGLGRSRSPGTSATRSRTRRWCAPTSTSPTRRSSPAPRPRSSRSVRSTTAPSATASPGPITKKIQEMFFAAVRGQVDRTRTGSSMSSDARRRHRHQAPHEPRSRRLIARAARGSVDIYDTTLPRRLAARGLLAHRRRQAPRRRATRPPRRRLHRRRLAGRESEGRGVLRPRPGRAEAFDRHARRVRLDPDARGEAPTTTRCLRNLVKAGTEAVCIVAKASQTHVTEALRTDFDEAVAMAADSVTFLRQNDLRVFFDAEHFFDGYIENPSSPCGCSRRSRSRGRDAGAL